MLTWVIGAGGLLGRAISRRSASTFVGSAVAWADPRSAISVLEADLAGFCSVAGRGDWSIIWAAGAGVVASNESELKAETVLMERFVSSLEHQHPPGNGAFFLASSAGGVYAGSSDAPFTEATPPRPLTSYGAAKLEQEDVAARLLESAVPVSVGRLSNVFGPGQNLAKPQGLVSQLCLAAVTRRPVNIFVPMDTSRDYLYVDDAARMIVAVSADVVRRQPQRAELRILASGRPTSVGSLLRTVQLVAHRPIRVGLGRQPGSDRHARDLRIQSNISDRITRMAVTSLPVGVKLVHDHTLALLRRQPILPAMAAGSPPWGVLAS
jgi:UDP-glucose 4-epimerase